MAYLTTRGPVKAVDGVSFAIQPGEVVGLAGESGSGKSTIAHAILRILHPPALITGGQALFDGRDILEMNDAELGQFRWSRISIVFQSAMNALNPVMKYPRSDHRCYAPAWSNEIRSELARHGTFRPGRD